MLISPIDLSLRNAAEVNVSIFFIPSSRSALHKLFRTEFKFVLCLNWCYISSYFPLLLRYKEV